MFPSKALFSLILVTLVATLAEAVSVGRRTGKATLSFATRINGLGNRNIAEMDRARVQALLGKGGGSQVTKRSAPEDSIMNAMVIYQAQVCIGSPPTNYTLIVDTGSSNTWVGAGKAYVKTATSQDTGAQVSVKYGSGNFSGEEYLDTLTLTPSLVINKQSIGVANTSQGFQGVDGILGLGPTDLTNGTISSRGTVPTVLDNLYAQHTIREEVLGVYFIPFSESMGGELTFGGVDKDAIRGPVFYVPLTTRRPPSHYWGIDQSISYGLEPLLENAAGIVDTGTTLVLIANDAFQKYQNLTGGVMDANTGLLKITTEQYAKLEPLMFLIGGVPFVLTPDAQIWPRSLNAAIGGDADGVYLIVNNFGSVPVPPGGSFGFVNGYAFLERFYSVYDATNRRVGLANTKYTFSTRNY